MFEGQGELGSALIPGFPVIPEEPKSAAPGLETGTANTFILRGIFSDYGVFVE